MSAAFQSIPLVSLAKWRSSDSDTDRQAFANELRDICHNIGFFVLVDHGIDHEFLARYFTMLKTFFALPEDVKAQIDKSRSPHFRGWERVGSEYTDNKKDYREQVDCSTENEPYPAGSKPDFLVLDGPNQWLPDGVLPEFKPLIQQFHRQMGELAEELMEILAIGLDLPGDSFARRFGERRHSLMKLISYPPTPPGEAGVNSHKDAGFLTLLHQHEVGGLQALNADGQWIDVPVIPGAININIGEMLQAMTANYYVSTIHKVVASEQRYSSAYFHGPDLRAGLEPLDLADQYLSAVAASERHRTAGYMAQREDLLAGATGHHGKGVELFGQQLWNYYRRSYPDNVRRFYPHLVDATSPA